MLHVRSLTTASCVEQVDIRKKPTMVHPNRIVIFAARENDVEKQEDDPDDDFPNELPLSSWH